MRVYQRLVVCCQTCDKRLPVLALGPPYAGYWSFDSDGASIAGWLLPATSAEVTSNPVCLCGDCRPKEQ